MLFQRSGRGQGGAPCAVGRCACLARVTHSQSAQLRGSFFVRQRAHAACSCGAGWETEVVPCSLAGHITLTKLGLGIGILRCPWLAQPSRGLSARPQAVLGRPGAPTPLHAPIPSSPTHTTAITACRLRRLTLCRSSCTAWYTLSRGGSKRGQHTATPLTDERPRNLVAMATGARGAGDGDTKWHKEQAHKHPGWPGKKK